MPEESSTVASATNTATDAPSSSTSSEQPESANVDVFENAKKLLGTGNKHMVMGNIPAAVSVFQEACGMLAKKYGDTADECAEAFFLCGKALLDLARMENGVLGNALQGVPEEEDGVEDETEKDGKFESTENLDDAEEDEVEEEDNAEDENTEDKESEEDEVGNLQLAWEMLEIAKVIYKRKESKEDQLRAAQTYLKLGEVGLESGNYTQAAEDFQECLTLQKKYLEPHSRLLAETYYQLGLVSGYSGQYDLAIQYYNQSVEVIQNRLSMLKEVLEKAENEDSVVDDKKEMEELKVLLPEIKEKIEDAKESKTTGHVASEAIKETMTGGSTSAFSGDSGSTSATPANSSEGASSKAVSDISHLVRKKRKPEDESPIKEAKKSKPETAVNGAEEPASNGNGVEKMEEEPSQSAVSVETSA
ncbi:nuclear autoantigenic sperm protein isoform X3 [Erpetoichthys calabaricus]|uniref:Nuclear autoantigenic sperm protein (histone-binding) n=1 Tax=Erpetoichthys calabaricus TaxID=27687 RepID=A0A8C4S529_ERPCA|nr:nuclear autoantigenic sperm protein isoform X3 [Erpetoichthys calabaricus]